MQNLLRKTLSVFALVLMTYAYSSAQCSQCTPDLACLPQGGSPFALCPDTPDNVTPNQFYDETLTLYVAESFEPQPGFTVTFDEIEILSFNNLPSGLVWSTNTPDNIFYPAQSEHNCIKVCGVSGATPGTYNADMEIRFLANAGAFGTFEDTNSFPITFTVGAGGSGNALFSLFPKTGCAPLSVTATNNFQESTYTPIPGVTQGVVYNWSFGNGDSSNLENPNPVTYNAQGSYPVNLNVVVDTFGFFLNEVRITSLGCTDPLDDPDVYVEIFDADSLVFTSVDNPVEAADSVTLGVNLLLINPPYTIEVWDAGGSGGLFSGDLTTDNCVNGTTASSPTNLSLPAIDSYGTSVLSATNGSLAFEYVIVKPVVTESYTDTVEVNGMVSTTPVISASATEVCVGTPATLTANSGFATYQWYLDGQIMNGETNSTLTTDVSGNYTVSVTEAGNSCDAVSSPVSITSLPAPSVPLVEVSGDTLFTQVVATGYQWFFNGNMIPGETNSFIIATVAGEYKLAVFNADGCGTYSKPEMVGSIGMEEAFAGMNVYPNPSNGNFTLEFSVEGSSTTNLSIYDLSGRLAHQETINGSGNIVYSLSLTNLPAGTYLLELSNDSGRNIQRISVQ